MTPSPRNVLACFTIVLALPLVAAATGTISGHVQDASGAPLACEIEVETADGEWVRSVECDVQGDYQVVDLEPGDYLLMAYVPENEDYYAQYYDGTVYWDEATPVEVVDGQTTSGIDFELALGARISGTVREAESGYTVSGIEVDVFDLDWRYSRYAVSTDDGTYAIPGIPPGTYLAVAYLDDGPWVDQYWDHMLLEDEATPITVVGTEPHDGIDFDLLREAVISGRVQRASDGAPVADAYVEAHELDWRFGRYASSGADGSFRIGQLAPATYRVWADAENMTEAYYADADGNPIDIPLAEGEEQTGVVIELAEGGAISGRVLRAADGSPVVYGYVSAWRPSDWWSAGGDTDEEGYFRVDGLPAGIYNILAEGNTGENLIPQTYVDENGHPVDIEVVVNQEVSGILFELSEGGYITGTVCNLDTGAPLADTYVYAGEIEGEVWRDTYTAADGSFQLAGLATADYSVTALHPDYVTQTYDHQLFEGTATPVPVEVGHTTSGIDFELVPGGKIAGTVVAADTGQPLEGVYVGVALDEDLWIEGAYTETNADGSYLIGSVPVDAAIYVLAYDWRERYAWAWYDNVFDFDQASPVPVLLGETTPDIGFELLRPGQAEVTPQSLSFSGLTYQEDIPPQNLTVTNLGPGPVGLDMWSEVEWMWVEYDWQNATLEAGEQLIAEVWVWTWGMSPGTYNDVIHVYDTVTWSEIQVPVTLTLMEAPPMLEVEPTELWFDAELEGDDPPSDALYLANLGGGTITFNATTDAAWIAVDPLDGALYRGDDATELEVSVAIAGLAEGDHHGTITLATSAGDRQVDVYLYVAPAADGQSDLEVQQQVTMVVPPSPKAPQEDATGTFWVGNDGDGTLYWDARDVAEWITMEPSSGSIPPGGEPVDVNLTVHLEDLPNGMNSAFIEVASSRETAWVEVGVQLGGETDTSGGVTAHEKGHLMVPVVVHGQGVGDSEFVSDLWIAHRPSGKSAQATLAFIPEGEDGNTTAVITDLVFESGQTIALLDVVSNWLGDAISKGSLVIQSDDIDEFEVMSRTYNLDQGAGGKDEGGMTATYGQDIPGSSSDDGVGRLEGALYIAGLEKSAGFRSNVLLTEVEGALARVRVELLDRDGQALGSTERDVAAFSTTQINDVFAAVGFEGSADGVLAVVEVLGGDGRVMALGSVVDNATNDPTTVFGVPKASSVGHQVVPVVAHAEGVADTQWVSDLNIANVDSTERQVTVSYHDRWGSEVAAHQATVAAHSTLTLRDVVATTFGLQASRGSISIESRPVGGLVVTSRTYNDGPEGTYGQGLAGAATSTSIGAGSQLLRLIALQNTDRFRTNLGLTETTGAEVEVGVTLLDKDGELLGYKEVEVPAHGQFQANIFDDMGLGTSNVVAATAIVQVVSGDGGVMSYGSTVDNRTGDGTTLPPPTRVEEGDIVMPEPPRP